MNEILSRFDRDFKDNFVGARELNNGASKLLRVNMGCGTKHVNGYVNVDNWPDAKPDILHDIENFPWPFSDGSVDEFLFCHVLEHVGKEIQVFYGIIKEIYRSLRLGGKCQIIVPHPRSDMFLGDPTHVRVIIPEVTRHFSRKHREEWIANGYATSPFSRGVGCEVDLETREIKMVLMPFWQTKLDAGAMTQEQIHRAAQTYNNVVNEIHITLEKAS